MRTQRAFMPGTSYQVLCADCAFIAPLMLMVARLTGWGGGHGEGRAAKQTYDTEVPEEKWLCPARAWQSTLCKNNRPSMGRPRTGGDDALDASLSIFLPSSLSFFPFREILSVLGQPARINMLLPLSYLQLNPLTTATPPGRTGMEETAPHGGQATSSFMGLGRCTMTARCAGL